MHSLDVIVYFISIPIIWQIIRYASNEEFTQELGTLIGYGIILVYTIIYVIIFGVFDVNWSDIHFTFGWLKNINLKW